MSDCCDSTEKFKIMKIEQSINGAVITRKCPSCKDISSFEESDPEKVKQAMKTLIETKPVRDE